MEIHNPLSGQTMKFLVDEPDLLRLECVSPPSPRREPEHIHPLQTNRFILEKGTLTFVIEGREKIASPGETVSVPPGLPHHFFNGGTEDAVYLQEFEPGLKIGLFFQTFFQLVRLGKVDDQGMPNLLQALVLTDAYWNELRLTRPPFWIQRVAATLLAPVGRWAGYRATPIPEEARPVTE